MAYLDGTSVTVDAVLTKQGRRLLSEGRGLNITHFTVHDTGVDYTLWNPDHASGSADYGSAIKSLPMIEGNSNGEYLYRNKLFTADRTLVALPTLYITGASSESGHEFQESAISQTVTLTVETLNWGGQENYYTVVYNNSVLNIVEPRTITDIGETPLQFLYQQDIVNAMVAYGPSPTVLAPAADDIQRRTMVTIVGESSGAFKDLEVTVQPNALRVTLPAGSFTKG